MDLMKKQPCYGKAWYHHQPDNHGPKRAILHNVFASKGGSLPRLFWPILWFSVCLLCTPRPILKRRAAGQISNNRRKADKGKNGQNRPKEAPVK